MSAEGFDVIVVGSGSAGGTLAARLSEDPACRVLLMEAGPDFPDEEKDPPVFYAAGALQGQHGVGMGPPDGRDWGYRSEVLPLRGSIPLRRGRLVGGSSMTNGSIAVRGRPEDFERWEQAGAAGWAWGDVLPLYQIVERELRVQTYPRELWLPVQDLVVNACVDLGFRYADDLNAPDAWDGVVGAWPRSRHNEMRLGTLNTYIRRARGRENFTIWSGVTVDRVLFERGRAVGASYIDENGAPGSVHADRIVLSAGAYGSAPILLRSGVGPASELEALDVEVVADLPVGRNLMEHPAWSVPFHVKPELARMGWPAFAAVARGRDWWAIPEPWDAEQALVSIKFCLATTEGPEGGRISLSSTDPTADPLIDHGYLAAIEGGAFDSTVEDFRALFETPSFLEAAAADPAAGIPWRERLLSGLVTAAHPAGGCSIGQVVSPDLEVYGVDGLSVADASVFPRHVTNNPNTTCFVIGEKAAQAIRRAS